MAGGLITDEILEWPPDLFALANVVLERAEAFRFALSPVGEWLPARIPDWARAVEKTGREWSVWVEDRRGAVPDLLAEEWSIFRNAWSRHSNSWRRETTSDCVRRCSRFTRSRTRRALALAWLSTAPTERRPCIGLVP